MAPRKPNYPYDCPLLLSKDDVKDLRQANVTLAQIATMLAEVKEMTTDNQHTLRGYNGNDGMISRLTKLEEQLSDAQSALQELKNLPADLKAVQTRVDALKDVPAAIDTWKRYPSLTWMVRHKFKEMSVITAVAVALTILLGFPNYYVGERLQQLIELLFAKWLRM